MNYAVINASGAVVNVIEWEEGSQWTPPDDCLAIPLLEGGIGWTFADGTFHPPTEPGQVK